LGIETFFTAFHKKSRELKRNKIFRFFSLDFLELVGLKEEGEKRRPTCNGKH